MRRRYRLTARLETGALAELYKGRIEGAEGHEVLVKLFGLPVSDLAYAMALSDLGTRTRALGNPLALGNDDVGLVVGRIAAVREYIDGYTLGDALRRLASREVRLPPALALFLLAETAAVVASAHSRGWAHGALTPGNVLLGRDGRIRVVDFGALEALAASPSLAALLGKGRQVYRAPESRKPGQSSPVADVYSLGAIGYELLTLQDVSGTRTSKISTRRDALTPPSRVARHLNGKVDPLFLRALDPAASRRWPDAGEFEAETRRLLEALGEAPSTAQLSRFVKELFPNEVSIGGGAGALAIEEAFELERVTPEATTFISEPPADMDLDERASFIGPEDLPPVIVQEGAGIGRPIAPPSPGPLPAARSAAPTLPEFEAAAAPEAPKGASATLQDWEAPPGPMPHAHRLHSLPVQEEIATEPGVHVDLRGPSRPPAKRQGQPPQKRAPSVQVEDAAFDAADIDAPSAPLAEQRGAPKRGRAGTAHGWKVKPVDTGFYVSRRMAAAGAGAGIALAAAGLLLVGLVARRDPPPPAPPLPAAVVQPLGTLALTTDVPAAIFVDGADTGRRTPLEGLSLAAGEHKVLLVHENLRREFTITLQPGETVRRSETLRPRPEPSPRPKRGRR